MATDYNDFEALRPQLLALARALRSRMRASIDPEDLVQAVLTEIYAKLKSGKEIRNPHSYANMAIKNRLLDSVRRMSHKLEMAWPRSPGDDSSWEPPDKRAVHPGLDPEIRDVLARLDEGERCFLWRVVFEQHSVPSAQKLCGWPDKSPYFHLRRLLDGLRPHVGLLISKTKEDDS